MKIKIDEIDLGDYFCGIKYFTTEIVKVEQPTQHVIELALNGLQNETDNRTRTVEIFRLPDKTSKVNVYCMQIQGEMGRCIVAVSHDNDYILVPDFNKLDSAREDAMYVIGEPWPSALVCTDFNLLLEVALEFGLKGKIAYPDIWDQMPS